MVKERRQNDVYSSTTSQAANCVSQLRCLQQREGHCRVFLHPSATRRTGSPIQPPSQYARESLPRKHRENYSDSTGDVPEKPII